MIKPEVMQALQQIQVTFPDAKLEWHEDGRGGCWFFLEPVDPGSPYSPRAIWAGGDISAMYPNADVYPVFVSPTLQRVDQRSLGEAITTGHNFHGRPAIQVSRASRHRNPALDTAANKLIKVLQWLSSR